MRANDREADDCVGISPGDDAHSVPLGPITTGNGTFIPASDFDFSHMIVPGRGIVVMIRLRFGEMGMYVPLNADALRLLSEKALGVAAAIEADAAQQTVEAIDRARFGGAA